MVLRLLPLVGAVMLALTGFNVLGTPGCESVSFDYRGARVFTVQCFPDSSGAIPSDVAGVGLLAGSGLMIWIWWRLRRRPTRQKRSSAAPHVPPPQPRKLQHSPVSSVALLLLGAPEDPQLQAPLLTMIKDFRANPATRATRIAQRPLSSKITASTAELAESVVEAVLLGGPISEGLAHGIFTAEVHDAFNVDLSNPLPIHQAICHAVSGAAALLVNQGRLSEVKEVVDLGRRLFANAALWDAHRRTHNPIGGGN